MTTDKQMPGGTSFGQPGYQSSSRPGSNLNPRTCSGQCVEEARAVLNGAITAAQQAGQTEFELEKRFQFLLDVAATDRHKEAEILLEQALAIYEAVYGQEHDAVGKMLLDLASLYQAHGNADYASYLKSWAGEILNTPKEEPTHEFFHLFGMDIPEEDPGLSDQM